MTEALPDGLYSMHAISKVCDGCRRRRLCSLMVINLGRSWWCDECAPEEREWWAQRNYERAEREVRDKS